MARRGVVTKQASLQSETKSIAEDNKLVVNKVDFKNQIRESPLQDRITSKVDSEPVPIPTCIYLNLEDLKCFEVVDRQYEQWGVVFNNCIAIQPSNPAFPTRSGLVVLMGAPKNGFLEATFMRPVHFVSAYVTSSQRLVLSAYGSDRQLITQTVLPGANLANSDYADSTDSAISPNTLVSISAHDIHHVTFCAFDGHFIIDDFSFCY
jgi:hypothetical protein